MSKFNKKYVAMTLFGLIIISFFGFLKSSKAQGREELGEILKPVKIVESNYETVFTELEYIGLVSSKEYIRYSSEIYGKINKIFVENGQLVKIDEKLVEIDKDNVGFLLDSGELKLDQSLVGVQTASENIEYLKKNLDRSYELYMAGALSENAYEDIKFNYDLALSNFERARNNYEMARVALDKNKKDFSNGIIRAKKNGVVAEIIMKEGEMIDVGTPIVVVRDEVKVINIGVTGKDLKHIELGYLVGVNIDNTDSKGVVSEINHLPDEETGLYVVQIRLENNNYFIGEIGKVTLVTDKKVGVKVPISSIGRDDFDYIFVKKGDKAVKTKIEILGIYKDFLLITGVDEKDKIIIQGMGPLNDGDLVRELER